MMGWMGQAVTSYITASLQGEGSEMTGWHDQSMTRPRRDLSVNGSMKEDAVGTGVVS
jgi:hypothetical protein